MRLILVLSLFAFIQPGLAAPISAQDEPPGDSPRYFVEEFDDALPADWQVEGSWRLENGRVISDTDGDVVTLPGEWADFSLKIRLRNEGSGIRSIVFRAADPGSYQIHFRREGIALLRTDERGLSSWLDWQQGRNHEDWLELVLIAEGERLFATLDGEILFDYLAPTDEALLSGALGFYNISGLLELDSFALAPIIYSPALLAEKWSQARSSFMDIQVPDLPTATTAPTATTPPRERVRFTLNGWEEPLTINAGQCVDLRWNAEGAIEVYYQGERTAISGYWQDCPSESQVYELRAVFGDGAVERRSLRLQVIAPSPVPATQTPVQPENCRLTPVRLNMNLREGDTTEYRILGRLNVGDYAEVIGRNLADTWYRVNFEGLDAWVAGRGYTRLEGDCSYVLLRTYAPANPPPTPTFAPPTEIPPPTAIPRANPSLLVNGNTNVYINRGQCVTISWYADGIRGMYLQGVGVTGPYGERQECPQQSITYHLRVEWADGSHRDLYATVNVSG